MKADRAKLPKTIGGLKIPKGLREAGWLDDLVGSPAGRALLAEAIVKAADAAAAVLLAARDEEDAPADETGEREGGEAEPEPVEEAPDAAPPKPRGRRRKSVPGVDPGTGEPDQAAPSAGS